MVLGVGHRQRTVRLIKPHRHEKRPVVRRLHKFHHGLRRGARRGRVRVVRIQIGQDRVVAHRRHIRRRMLHARQGRLVAVRLERVYHMLRVIAHCEPPVPQPQHPARMRVHPAEKARPAGRTRGRRRKRLAEQHAFLRQPLQVRRRNRVPVRLHVTPRIVRMHKNDIRPRLG